MNDKHKHKLSGVPTVYEETHKIIDKKDIKKIEEHTEEMEAMRKERDEKAILNLINKHGKSNIPLVEQLSLEHATYQEALKSLLSLKNHKTFETMMLLFEYMEKNKTFKLDKITGTELLKLGGYTGTKQVHRDQILRRIDSHANLVIKVLDPQASIQNYKNKKANKGLEYKNVTLFKVSKVVYSLKNRNLITELRGIEFLPDYIEFLQNISRRYLPLESIRKIKKDSPTDKTRHFLYKLCFKFAGMSKMDCKLNLQECMNLGKFYNIKSQNLQRKWKPIEKALIKGKECKLLTYKWIFREVTEKEINKDNLIIDSVGQIIIDNLETIALEDKLYKYIQEVHIIRNYNLNAPQITLPFELENKKAIKENKPKEWNF